MGNVETLPGELPAARRRRPAVREQQVPRGLVDALPAAVYTTDAAGRITYYNEAAAELWGYRPELGKSAWCGSWKLYWPDGTPMAHDECPMALALRDKRPIRGMDAIAERPDGTRVPFMPYPTPLFDASGILIGAVNMLVDMTRQREAGERLDASEARYRGIFEGARVALWDQDFSPLLDLLDELRAQGVTDVRAYFETRPEELAKAVSLVQVRDVNNYAVKLFEADDKKALLGALGTTFLPETQPVFVDEMVALWEGRRDFESEAPARTLKGRRLTILLTIAWSGERCEHSLVSILDISKQKAAEQVRQQLVSIIESSNDAIISKDLDGVIVSWNKGAERLFGYSAEEAVGRPITILIPEENRDEEPKILERIRRGERLEHYETVRRRKDGRLVDISLTVSPVRHAEGRIVGASKIARDITGRKRGEEALARRMDEHAALYQFTDRLHRAESLGDVYEAALDAILRALRCNRASILLFDDAGVMRFAAWRELSDGYRSAVDGHSPWTPDERTPQPILIEDVEAADIDASLKSTIEKEGIRALAFIPLVSKGKLVGKFMTYYEAPHVFTDAEVDLAVTIARQLGFGVERMRAEEALHESEERFSRFMQQLPGLAWIKDMHGRYVYANDAAARVFRTHRDRLYGKTDEELFPPELAAQFRENDQKALAKGAGILVVETLEHEDGVVHHSLVSKFPMPGPNDQTTQVGGMAIDITDRQRAEEELRRNEERLRLATQTGKIGLWEWDIPGNSVSWTESLYAMHGVTKDEFSATAEGFSSLVHPEDRDRVSQAIKGALEKDLPYELEFRVLKPDGAVVWIFTNATVLRRGGKPVRMLGATVDITERKQAEVQRDLLVAELSHRVKNTLATVISIARQSFSNAQSADEASRSFNARIRALAQTHGRLAEANWAGVSFETMLLDELAPYRGEDGANVRVSGPPIALNPKCALTLGMAIHELVTNGAKYGALSTTNGSVDVVWELHPADKQLRIRWTERGGPRVRPPARSGFGRLLLERALASDLRGDVQLHFAEGGLECAIAIPLDELAA